MSRGEEFWHEYAHMVYCELIDILVHHDLYAFSHEAEGMAEQLWAEREGLA